MQSVPERPLAPPAGADRRPMSRWAVASLVFGLFGGSLFSVVFGIIALRRIRARGQRGRGFAIAGLVLSGLWTLLIVFGIAG